MKLSRAIKGNRRRGFVLIEAVVVTALLGAMVSDDDFRSPSWMTLAQAPACWDPGVDPCPPCPVAQDPCPTRAEQDAMKAEADAQQAKVDAIKGKGDAMLSGLQNDPKTQQNQAGVQADIAAALQQLNDAMALWAGKPGESVFQAHYDSIMKYLNMILPFAGELDAVKGGTTPSTPGFMTDTAAMQVMLDQAQADLDQAMLDAAGNPDLLLKLQEAQVLLDEAKQGFQNALNPQTYVDGL